MMMLAGASVASAADFKIRSAKVVLINEVYYLDASIDYQFSSKVLEALHKGVPLTISLDIEVLRSRKYLWSETMASLEQRYQLVYQPLTEQYRVVNLNSGSERSYASLPDARVGLGEIVELPVIDKKLLREQASYMVRLQASLDIQRLPVPMQLMAYITPDWHLSSDPYTWPLP